jgi:cytochrome P450
MVRDFQYFTDRIDRSFHPIVKHFLTALKGDEWRATRSLITPTFTSGKMKNMMPLMMEAADSLGASLQRKAAKNEAFDPHQVFGFYSTDVVAKIAFATNTDVQEKGYDSPFMKHSSTFGFPPKWRTLLMMMLPKLMYPLLLKANGGESLEYLAQVAQNILSQRLENANNNRNYKDFLQLMIDAMQGKSLVDMSVTEDRESHHVHEGKQSNSNEGMTTRKLSREEVIANCIMVLASGYVTTATLLTYVSYSLAVNQDKQEKLRDEIQTAFKDEKINYEQLSSLKYLDAVICETLRLYPPAMRLERLCTQDYVLQVTIDGKLKKIKIKAGDKIRFPIYAMQRDEKYYPNPTNWEPERFLPENKDKLTPYTYLPFGGGPRNCIGMRFALLEAKLALAKSLLNFRFVPSVKTPLTPDFSNAFNLLAAKDLIIQVEKL